MLASCLEALILRPAVPGLSGLRDISGLRFKSDAVESPPGYFGVAPGGFLEEISMSVSSLVAPGTEAIRFSAESSPKRLRD